jgi:hypothetical protein
MLRSSLVIKGSWTFPPIKSEERVHQARLEVARIMLRFSREGMRRLPWVLYVDIIWVSSSTIVLFVEFKICKLYLLYFFSRGLNNHIIQAHGCVIRWYLKMTIHNFEIAALSIAASRNY